MKTSMLRVHVGWFVKRLSSKDWCFATHPALIKQPVRHPFDQLSCEVIRKASDFVVRSFRNHEVERDERVIEMWRPEGLVLADKALLHPFPHQFFLSNALRFLRFVR